MKLNKNLVIELLQNELIYERLEHQNALAELVGWREDADRFQEAFCQEQQAREKLKSRTGKAIAKLFSINCEISKDRMNLLTENEKNEDLVFDLADDIFELHKDITDLQADMADHFNKSEMKKDIEDLQADTAYYCSQLKKTYREGATEYENKIKKLEEDLKRYTDADATELEGETIEYMNKLEEDYKQKSKELELAKDAIASYCEGITTLNQTIAQLKDEIEIKEKVNKEGIYADKKCRYDLEQKIIALQKENNELKERLNAGDKKENKENAETQKSSIVMSGDHSGCKHNNPEKANDSEKKIVESIRAKNNKEIEAVKSKLRGKGYSISVSTSGIIAKKQGTRHIEVRPAELPGSLKYKICGQTVYTFDEAIKASVYGVKTIVKKDDEAAESI